MNPGEEAEGWRMMVCTRSGVAKLCCDIRQVILRAQLSYFLIICFQKILLQTVLGL